MYRLKNRILSTLAAIALLVGAAACNNAPAATDPQGNAAPNEASATTSGGEAKSDILIGFVILTQTNPYFVAEAETARKICEKNGWQFKLYDSQMDSAKELKAVEDLISQGADLILIDNVDPQACVAAIQQAYDAGIPVIGVDSQVDPSAPVATVVTAASAAGAIECGLWLGEKTGDTPVKAAVISGMKGNPIGQLRRDGLFAGLIEAQMKTAGTPVDKAAAWAESEKMEAQLVSDGRAVHETLPFEIVAQGWGGWNSEGGLDAMEDIITAHPDINVLFAENDNMAIGAMNAIAEAGLEDKILIVAGADGQKEAYALIKEGRYGATSENNPVKIITMALDIANEILVDGKDPYSYPKQIDTEPVCINASNVDEFYNPDALF